jgi:hypothetical protein
MVTLNGMRCNLRDGFVNVAQGRFLVPVYQQFELGDVFKLITPAEAGANGIAARQSFDFALIPALAALGFGNHHQTRPA